MQQQHKNLLLFVVLSLLILVGWTAIQNTLWPPPPRKAIDKKIDEEEAKAHPWTDITPAALAAQVGGMAQPDPAFVWIQLALGNLAASQRDLWALKAATPPAIVAPEQPEKTFVFGTDKSNLRVTLSNRGASVKEIVLLKFQQANSLGLPVWKKDETNVPEPLHLVPVSEDENSYLFYHYPSGKATNPVNTLGTVTWEAGEPVTDSETGEQRISLWRTIPALNVKVTKTFVLRPDDYHLGLEIRIEALGDRVPEFRYQLAGAHGLPIEGEWYTYTYRNSLIGVIDGRGNVYRDLQDSRVVGLADGGKQVFNGKEPGSYIGYAGIVNQYFASMIAVDENQDEGVGKSFLEWARPTREGILTRPSPTSTT